MRTRRVSVDFFVDDTEEDDEVGNARAVILVFDIIMAGRREVAFGGTLRHTVTYAITEEVK